MYKSMISGILLVVALRPCYGQVKRIYWTDRGIRSRENTTSVTGAGDFTIPIQMPQEKVPSDEAGWQSYTADIASQISGFLAKKQSSGAQSIEVLTGEDIKAGGYFADPSRIAQTESFMAAVGRAISTVKTQNPGLEVDSIFGSFSGQAFTDVSLGLSEENANPIDKMLLVNSRASVQNTIEACDVLPTCTILVSAGDLPSEEMGMGDQFRRVANRQYAMEAADASGQITLIEADPEGFYFPVPGFSSHIMLEDPAERDANFRYRQYLGDGKWSDWQTTTGEELLTKLLNTSPPNDTEFDRLVKKAQSQNDAESGDINNLEKQLGDERKQLEDINRRSIYPNTGAATVTRIPAGWVPCQCPADHPYAGILVGNVRWHTPLLRCPQ